MVPFHHPIQSNTKGRQAGEGVNGLLCCKGRMLNANVGIEWLAEVGWLIWWLWLVGDVMFLCLVEAWLLSVRIIKLESTVLFYYILRTVAWLGLVEQNITWRETLWKRLTRWDGMQSYMQCNPIPYLTSWAAETSFASLTFLPTSQVRLRLSCWVRTLTLSYFLGL